MTDVHLGRACEERALKTPLIGYRSYRVMKDLGLFSATAATWVQAIVVVIALFYASWQLGQLVEQNQIPKRKDYYDYYKIYEKNHQRSMDTLRTLAYRARLPEVSPEQLATEIGSNDPKRS